MLKKFFSQFIDPMGIDDVSRPPDTAPAFFRYYLYPIRWFLVALLTTSGIATVSELMLYVYLGDIVDVEKYETPREAFAGWVTSKTNPRFTINLVNRLWKQAFGLAQQKQTTKLYLL